MAVTAVAAPGAGREPAYIAKKPPLRACEGPAGAGPLVKELITLDSHRAACRDCWTASTNLPRYALFNFGTNQRLMVRYGLLVRTPDPGQVVQFVHAVDARRRLSWAA